MWVIESNLPHLRTPLNGALALQSITARSTPWPRQSLDLKI
jgi:hypothetical protein